MTDRSRSRLDPSIAPNGAVPDAELRRILRDADSIVQPSVPQLHALNARIMKAAAPTLEARAAGERTVWDYAERWSAVLLPVGAFATLAAGLCLFVLAGPNETVASRTSTTRVALMGAATNRVSSQNLLDLLVATDGGKSSAQRDEP